MSFFVLYSTYKGTLLDISAEPFNSVDITEGQAVKEFHEEMPDMTKVFWVPNTLSFHERDRSRVLTKLSFRRLFTFEEQMAADTFNMTFEANENIPANFKAMIRTGLSNFNAALDIDLDDEDVQTVLEVYCQFGILTPERVSSILA